MTGECFALLRQQSILARSLPADEAAPWAPDAFDAGVARAQQPGGLLHPERIGILHGLRVQALVFVALDARVGSEAGGYPSPVWLCEGAVDEDEEPTNSARCGGRARLRSDTSAR